MTLESRDHANICSTPGLGLSEGRGLMSAVPKLVAFDPTPDEIPSVGEAVSRSQEFLLSIQKPDGHWEGELFVDATLCCDTILYMHWTGRVDDDLQKKCAAHIRRRQTQDGGWNIFVGGPSEINASVKAYFALKLA
ncbi:MAG: hypothetical protein ACOYNN_12685, partial [Terrimicrobiaceae bacterium]